MTSESLRLQDGDDYISSGDIAQTVQQMGDYYSDYFADKEMIHAIVLMRGAMIFASDLVRAIDHPHILFDDTRPNSYRGINPRDSFTFLSDHEHSLAGHNLLVFEDILDGGRTLSRTTKRLADYCPASLAVATMFEKPEARKPGTELAGDDLQVGIPIANEFVVGYGLDWNERYRNLGHVSKVVESGPDFFEPKVSHDPAPNWLSATAAHQAPRP